MRFNFLFLTLQVIAARVFRLKHPKENLFIGGLRQNPYFVDFKNSYIFQDIESIEEPGMVRILVPELKNSLWLILKKEKFLIFHENHGAKNQLFKVQFIARDVVAIESELGGCLKYDDDQEKIVLDECNYSKNFKNQTFLVTDENGRWYGKGSFKEGWGSEVEDQVKWGNCESCAPGGFGALEQGIEFEQDLANGLYLNFENKSNQYIIKSPGLHISMQNTFGENDDINQLGFSKLDRVTQNLYLQNSENEKDLQNGQYIEISNEESNQNNKNAQNKSMGKEKGLMRTSLSEKTIFNPITNQYRTPYELETGMAQPPKSKFPSTFIIGKEMRDSALNGTADADSKSGTLVRKRHVLDLPRSIVPELKDDEKMSQFLKTGKLISQFSQDSFGNDLKSENHKLDVVFDGLSPDAKKDALNLAGIYVGDRSIHSSKTWPHNSPVPVGDITMGFGHRWE